MTLSLTQSLSDFWFWHYRVTLEACDLWGIWPEGWVTWPKNFFLQLLLNFFIQLLFNFFKTFFNFFLNFFSTFNPRDLWLLRYLIRVMRKHDLTRGIWMHYNITLLIVKTPIRQNQGFRKNFILIFTHSTGCNYLIFHTSQGTQEVWKIVKNLILW